MDGFPYVAATEYNYIGIATTLTNIGFMKEPVIIKSEIENYGTLRPLCGLCHVDALNR